MENGGKVTEGVDQQAVSGEFRALGVDDLTIKEILRHSDVSVTRAGYIKRIDEKSVEAMN
jgi:hypothetical protein